jgi:hypothetical protein
MCANPFFFMPEDNIEIITETLQPAYTHTLDSDTSTFLNIHTVKSLMILSTSNSNLMPL